MPRGLLTAYGDTGEKQAENLRLYTTGIMTSGVHHDRIQISREERSRNDAPDYAFMHIHDRSDADADRCFGMLTWNANRYHRKRIGSCYGQLI